MSTGPTPGLVKVTTLRLLVFQLPCPVGFNVAAGKWMHEDPQVSALSCNGGERSWIAQKRLGHSWIYVQGASVWLKLHFWFYLKYKKILVKVVCLLASSTACPQGQWLPSLGSGSPGGVGATWRYKQFDANVESFKNLPVFHSLQVLTPQDVTVSVWVSLANPSPWL